VVMRKKARTIIVKLVSCALTGEFMSATIYAVRLFLHDQKANIDDGKTYVSQVRSRHSAALLVRGTRLILFIVKLSRKKRSVERRLHNESGKIVL